MADAADATKLLDIDVDQLARAFSLVSDDRLGRVEVLQAREAGAGQDASDRGATQADSRGDLTACIATSSKSQDLLDTHGMGLARHSVGPRTAIDQRRLAGLSISRLPLKRRPPRYTSRLGGAGRAHPLKHPRHQQHSTGRASSGILVQLHLGSFDDLLALNTSRLIDLDPDGQLPHGNNVLRNHT
jgi:hypothetical protein